MLNKIFYFNLFFLLAGFCITISAQTSDKQDWTHYARISGHVLGPQNIEGTIEKAHKVGTLGIELDNDITGRYDSFLNPEQKLKEIEAAAVAAHKIGNFAYIYIAGLECITENADKAGHSMFKDHPDWVQRDIIGKPAVFTGGASFWVINGEEDVWISPYAKEWRTRYMEIVRRITATGIDGIYIDVAYWMWLYEGWENKWVSYDDYTVAAFKAKTGLDARKDFIPGDFNNPAFLKWVDFRIETITGFFKEIYENVKSVNPKCLVIPEISPSVDADVVRSGTDAYEIQKYSNVIAHEFYINTNTGAKRNTFDWITYSLGINTLRAFDENHATWLLSYSWDHEKNTNARDAMKLLSCTQLMSQGNYWDAPGHLMAGSNDYSLRKEIFGWIKANEDILYTERKPVNPIGVYFVPGTRNYFMDDYIKSYYGILHLLLNNHLEYQVLTPRTIKDFKGSVLILPDAAILSAEETDLMKEFYKKGMKLILTGETGYYDSVKTILNENSFLNYLCANKSAGRDFLYLPECPGKKYFDKKDTAVIISFSEQLREFLPGFKQKFNIKASNFVKTQTADLGNKYCIFISNLKGLKGYSTCIPASENKIEINYESGELHNIYYMPYLGRKKKITEKVAKNTSGKSTVSFILPKVQFGGVVIIDK